MSEIIKKKFKKYLVAMIIFALIGGLSYLSLEAKAGLLFQEARLWQIAADADAPAHINTAVSSNSTAATTLTVTMPTFIADDVVVACIASTNAVDPSSTIATPSGWTALNGTGVNITSTSAVRLQCFYRLMQGGDPASVDFTVAASAGFVAFASSYRGCDTTTPVQTSATNTTATADTSAIHPSVLTTADNETILRVVSQDDQEAHTNAGVTWRTPDQSVTNGIDLPGNGTNINMGDEVQALAGNTGTSVTTLGLLEEWGTYTIALNPTLNTAPNTPTLDETPAFPNMLASTTAPVLGGFSATDDDSDDVAFWIEWSTSTDFASVATSSSEDDYPAGWASATTTSGATTTYTIQSALSEDTVYWWRVRARDPEGSNEWSSYTTSTERSISASSTLEVSRWFQTTGEQFDTDTLTNVATTSTSTKLIGW